jgi:hypothetical protein
LTGRDFYQALHVEHIAEYLPPIEPYLSLPPGYRFQIADGYEDVWFDPALPEEQWQSASGPLVTVCDFSALVTCHAEPKGRMAEVSNEDLAQPLCYRNARGECRKHSGSLLLHFFNHQTHHRGRATTLMSQSDVDIGVTDLLE